MPSSAVQQSPPRSLRQVRYGTGTVAVLEMLFLMTKENIDIFYLDV